MAFDTFPFIASFVAGVATFISPCVLPLIPAYLSFITGTSVDEITSGGGSARKAFFSALFFVAGFSLIFVLLGASASYLGTIVVEHKDVIRWVGGGIVIVFGLHLMGVTPLRFLYREKRLKMKRYPLGYAGSFFVGIAFAVGWTPCVGPILSSILILASAQETVQRGIMLLIVYSLGLGVPFLITALFVNWALRMFERIKKHYRAVEIVSGGILVVVGILLITGSFSFIAGFLGGGVFE